VATEMSGATPAAEDAPIGLPYSFYTQDVFHKNNVIVVLI